jgi:hypothetical protein
MREIKQATVVIGPLTYQSLEEAYQQGSVGRQEPTQLLAAPVTRDQLVHFMVGMVGHADAAYVFNAAVIGRGPDLPPDVVLFIGGAHTVVLLLNEVPPTTDALCRKGETILTQLAVTK